MQRNVAFDQKSKQRSCISKMLLAQASQESCHNGQVKQHQAMQATTAFLAGSSAHQLCVPI